MLFTDFSPQMQESVVCSIYAAVKYSVPANIILAVAEKEGGKPGQWVQNSNGTYDVGMMQFNTSYLSSLAKYGITASDVAQAGCYSFDLAAWRLRGHIRNDKGDLWTRAANYHSRTPFYNARYRADLIVNSAKWADWLEVRLVTHDITNPNKDKPASLEQTKPTAVLQEEEKITAAAPATQQLSSWRSTGYVPRRLITGRE